MMPGLDIIFGGVTGLIGNAFTTWFKYKNAKMEYEHDEKMIKLKTDSMIQQSQMQIDITKSKVEGEIEIKDSEAFQVSQNVGSEKLFHEKWIDMLMEAGKSNKWFGWFFTLVGILIAAAFSFVDFLNSLMRPTLTLYLVGSSSYITYLAWQIIQKAGVGAITSTQAVNIFTQVTSSVIYLAVSAVTWWFGDRTMSKYLQQQGAKKYKQLNNTKPSKGGGDVDI